MGDHRWTGRQPVDLCYDRDTGELLATGEAASHYYLANAKRLAGEGTIIALASGDKDGWDTQRLLEDPSYRVAYSRHMRSQIDAGIARRRGREGNL